MKIGKQAALLLLLCLEVLYVSPVRALQDTNLLIENWQNTNLASEINFYGGAILSGASLQVGLAGLLSTGSFAVLDVPVDVRRSFDFSAQVAFSSVLPCLSLSDGLAFGFVSDSLNISPLSGLSLGLDPSKRLWAATVDSSGDGIDGALGANQWHVSYVSSPAGSLVFDSNFYNSTVISCSTLLNQVAQLRLVYISGTMSVYVNGLLVGSSSVDLAAKLGQSHGHVFFSGATGIASMNMAFQRVSYRQLLVNGDFEWTTGPASWESSASLQPVGSVPSTSCAPVGFTVTSSATALCTQSPALSPASGSRALMGIAEGALGSNLFSATQTITFPSGSLGATAIVLTPLIATSAASMSPARNLTISLDGQEIGVFLIERNSSVNGTRQVLSAVFAGNDSSTSSATLSIRASFSDGYNGPAAVGIDSVAVVACAQGESLNPTNLRCVNCPTGQTVLSLCKCSNNYILSHNASSAICTYCGDGNAALPPATTCTSCLGSNVQTPFGICAPCAGTGIPNILRTGCDCPIGFEGSVDTIVDNCLPISAPSIVPIHLPPLIEPLGSPIAPIQLPPVQELLPPIAIIPPIASVVVSPPVQRAPNQTASRSLQFQTVRVLSPLEQNILINTIANFTRASPMDIALSGNGTNAVKRATYSTIATFTGDSVAQFDNTFSANASAADSLAVLVSEAIPTLGNITISISSPNKTNGSSESQVSGSPEFNSELSTQFSGLTPAAQAGIAIGILLFLCLVGLAIFGVLTYSKKHRLPKHLRDRSAQSSALSVVKLEEKAYGASLVHSGSSKSSSESSSSQTSSEESV